MLKQMINLREQQENFEKLYLNHKATKSAETLGRLQPEEPCIIRTEFQRDRDSIIHSKAFRRLKHKTQVFIASTGDHYRTRLTHTLEVSQIARTIARALKLNEDLTEAIAMGHDLGHTPFGHTGEAVLNKLVAKGFRHNEQSERVVTVLENLNLTRETIDGIRNHTGNILPSTLEGQIVKIADRIAYINHDIDDSIRAGLITIEDLPKDSIHILGKTCSERITIMVCSMVQASYNQDKIKMEKDIQEATDNLRQWMFDNIYMPPIKQNDNKQKAEMVVKKLYNYYLENPDILKEYYLTKNIPSEDAVVDYIAGMTDRFAIQVFKQTFLPESCIKTFEY